MAQIQRQQKQEQKQQEHHYYDNSGILDIDNDVVFSVASVWISKQKDKNGDIKKERPTVQIPLELAKKHGIDKPCRVAFIDTNDGITMKFVHLNHYD